MTWLQQIEVVTGGSGSEYTEMVTWVDREVKPGNDITFKHDDRIWHVTKVYDKLMYREVRGWHNNI